MAKLKRLLIPEFWNVPKKIYKWAISPRPGPHKKFESIPLQVIVRDILKFAETGKEAKTIIKKGEILVDGKLRKDHAYPTGLFDTIAFPRTKQFYRIIPSSNGLKIIPIPENEANLKICKINNKTLPRGNKVQLNLNDGKNILVTDGKYKTGDSLLLELPSLKIIQHLQLAKGNLSIVSKGKNSGKIGKIKKILPGKMKETSKIICEIEGKDTEIQKDQLLVFGKEKPLITVSE